ncbi:DUF3052 domain-containing protein [Streptacidiphilus cavernicola]|uniref:DUF3052 domain-containing protein n=1 Tax=Streptacidiphilus cavernicola TaxID=3342716 RepID=A0ABV6VTF3_9ACTN
MSDTGTPLAKKLRIKAGQRVALVHPPQGWTVAGLAGLPERVEQTADTGGWDVAVAFFRTAAELEEDIPALVKALPSAGCLWIAWPRRAAGHSSDITDTLLRELLLPTGVVDVKVAALGEDWSGLAFVHRLANR